MDSITNQTIRIRIKDAHNVIFIGDTGIETGMVCEEGHDDILIQKKEGGVGILNNVQELSPWGDVQNQDGIGIESIEDDFHVDGNGIESIEDDFHVDSEDLRSTLEPKLHFLEERDEEILSSRILELSRSNKVRSALELYISMEASCLQPSTRACNSLLSCLLRNGFLNDALRVFETMKKETTSGHTYSLILKAVAKARGCDTALKMFMKLERKGTVVNIFDVITYNTMISICVKVNNWVQAERIWKSLKENGHRATTITYDLLVSTFVRCGQSELAFDAYSEMVQNGLKPSGDMMQALISACVKEGKWGLARSVFQSMLESGLNPNIVTYNALINSIGKAGEVELCFKVFGLMKNSGHTPDAYTWNALLGALNRGNRHMDTLRLFESIKRKKSIQLNAHLYNTALLSCQRLGSWDRSLQILWQMEASDIPISTESYNLVLGSCEAARKPKVALQVYEQMVHKKCIPDTFTYLSLIRSCSWGSLWSEVKEILDHVPPDVSLYNAVIHGMCLRGNISLAKKMYMKMCEIGLKPDGKTRALMIQNLRKNSITKNNRYPSQRHHHYA
ncbi:Pentatricopeptide repeat-containing protein [Thalictrum thalictroides]|uniref:Pentatricopeptide repeat-containing protein n=1 Tax=Thalictrum thalictroides TaxID=46969 RepID=A0A7J6VU71_THATH|nr:Pentatricopeptide repeat-containing protein [Thalictrum thalictroides]